MRILDLIPFILSAFAVRDFLLLKTGPDTKTSIRLLTYAVVTFLSVVLFFAATLALETDRLLRLIRSPVVLLLIALFHGALLALCIWTQRSGRHQFGWLIAVVPNPMLVLSIVLLARRILPQDRPQDRPVIEAALLTCIWIGVICLSVKGTSYAPLDVPDSKFSLGLAGVVNSAALLVLPLNAWVQGSSSLNYILR